MEDSPVCPKYQEQARRIQRNPFPNLNDRNSISPSHSKSKGSNNTPTMLLLNNRYTVHTQPDDEEDSASDNPLEEMEWDNDGDPSSKLVQSTSYKQYLKLRSNEQSYSEVVKHTSGSNNTPTMSTRLYSDHQKNLSRSSTEISLRGKTDNKDVPTSTIIKYVMDRQESQLNNILAAQSSTIQNIIEKQNQTLKESITHITNAIPTIVSKVIESILPTLIHQVKSTLAQDNSDNSSDNL
jgi:hypothetical protein